jgi:hypothetical protein
VINDTKRQKKEFTASQPKSAYCLGVQGTTDRDVWLTPLSGAGGAATLGVDGSAVI